MDSRIEKILSKKLSSLMPVSLLDEYNSFIDSDLRTVLCADCLKLYLESSINLLLKDEVIGMNCISTEKWNTYNLYNKIKLVGMHYDRDTERMFNKVREIGNKNSQYRGKVTILEVEEGIDIAVHIIEKILIKYFKKNHIGSEMAILTMLSSLPPVSRINILEELLHEGQNHVYVVAELTKAYLEDGDYLKSLSFLAEQKNKKVIVIQQYTDLVDNINALYQVFDKYDMDKNTLDVREVFNKIVRSYDYNRYKEFTNIFLTLVSGYCLQIN